MKKNLKGRIIVIYGFTKHLKQNETEVARLVAKVHLEGIAKLYDLSCQSVFGATASALNSQDDEAWIELFEYKKQGISSHEYVFLREVLKNSAHHLARYGLYFDCDYQNYPYKIDRLID